MQQIKDSSNDFAAQMDTEKWKYCKHVYVLEIESMKETWIAYIKTDQKIAHENHQE